MFLLVMVFRLPHHVSAFLGAPSARVGALLAHVHLVAHLFALHRARLAHVGAHVAHLLCVLASPAHHHGCHPAHVCAVPAHHHAASHLSHHVTACHCHALGAAGLTGHHAFVAAFDAARVLLVF